MIVVIDYGMGNLGSIVNMFNKIRADAVISSEASAIEGADKLVLPGVGAFDYGMKNLADRGLISLLNVKILQDKIPILGVCLGMQLFTQHSEEGQLPGLGWLDAKTVRFKFEDPNSHLKIPHMGWNNILIRQSNPIFTDMDKDSRFYFVHSYHVLSTDMSTVLAETQYGYNFTSAVVKENIIGVQFHPEKSHKFGMKLLKNFVECC